MYEKIIAALDAANEAKAAAGQSPRGRALAVLVTDLERCAAWAAFHRLDGTQQEDAAT